MSAPLSYMSIMVCNADVTVDTVADVNPTKGDILAHTDADVYNSAMVLVNDQYILPTKGDASCVSDVLLTKGDALCVSFIGYCMLNRDFAQIPSLSTSALSHVPPYFRPHFCECTFLVGKILVGVPLQPVSIP